MKISAATRLGHPGLAQMQRKAESQEPTLFEADSVELREPPPLENPDKAIKELAVGYGYVEFPQVSPDGHKLIFNTVGNYATSQMLIMDADGGDVRSLMDGRKVAAKEVKSFLADHDGSISEQGTWTADGRSIYFRSNQKGTFGIGRYDVKTGETELVLHDPAINMKHPVQVEGTQIVCYGGPPSEQYPTVDQYSNLFLADAATGERQMLTDSHGEVAYKHPSVMNGKLLAHVEPKDGGEEMADIILLDPQTHEQVRITNTPAADERHPFYNQATGLLVYHRKIGGDKNLVISTPDGSRTAQLTHYARPAQSPCWSPDGQKLYFVKKLERQPDDEPFYNRQAEIRVLDVRKGLKDLTGQARKRLKKLTNQGAPEAVIDKARAEYEDYRYFLKQYD